jgi:hypothetical protein
LTGLYLTNDFAAFDCLQIRVTIKALYKEIRCYKSTSRNGACTGDYYIIEIYVFMTHDQDSDDDDLFYEAALHGCFYVNNLL